MSRPHHLLFVCSGNICRSPIAEHLARQHGERTSVELEARSAGTLGLVDRPAEPQMVAVGREVGLDLSTHICQPLTPELIAWADHVLVMERMHYATVEEMAPDATSKLVLLGRMVDQDEIADPIGSWFRWQYRRTRDLLTRCVHRFVDQLPSDHED
jgi:protein-tyrosine phosphatase